jgi:hypothetical protein
VRASRERERDSDSEAKGGNFWRAEKVGKRELIKMQLSQVSQCAARPATCFVSLGNLMGVKRARFLALQLSQLRKRRAAAHTAQVLRQSDKSYKHISNCPFNILSSSQTGLLTGAKMRMHKKITSRERK